MGNISKSHATQNHSILLRMLNDRIQLVTSNTKILEQKSLAVFFGGRAKFGSFCRNSHTFLQELSYIPLDSRCRPKGTSLFARYRAKLWLYFVGIIIHPRDRRWKCNRKALGGSPQTPKSFKRSTLRGRKPKKPHNAKVTLSQFQRGVKLLAKETHERFIFK